LVGAGPDHNLELAEFDGVSGAKIKSFFVFIGGPIFIPPGGGGVGVAAAGVGGGGGGGVGTAGGPGVLTPVRILAGELAPLSAFPVNGLSYQGGAYVAAASARPIERTLAAAIGMNFQQGVGLLQNAQRQLRAGHTVAACNMLDAFTNQVDAQRGKSLTASQADL